MIIEPPAPASDQGRDWGGGAGKLWGSCGAKGAGLAFWAWPNQDPRVARAEIRPAWQGMARAGGSRSCSDPSFFCGLRLLWSTQFEKKFTTHSIFDGSAAEANWRQIESKCL